jgi:hypothetical protein
LDPESFGWQANRLTFAATFTPRHFGSCPPPPVARSTWATSFGEASPKRAVILSAKAGELGFLAVDLSSCELTSLLAS